MLSSVVGSLQVALQVCTAVLSACCAGLYNSGKHDPQAVDSNPTFVLEPLSVGSLAFFVKYLSVHC